MESVNFTVASRDFRRNKLVLSLQFSSPSRISQSSVRIPLNLTCHRTSISLRWQWWSQSDKAANCTKSSCPLVSLSRSRFRHRFHLLQVNLSKTSRMACSTSLLQLCLGVWLSTSLCKNQTYSSLSIALCSFSCFGAFWTTSLFWPFSPWYPSPCQASRRWSRA